MLEKYWDHMSIKERENLINIREFCRYMQINGVYIDDVFTHYQYSSLSVNIKEYLDKWLEPLFTRIRDNKIEEILNG